MFKFTMKYVMKLSKLVSVGSCPVERRAEKLPTSDSTGVTKTRRGQHMYFMNQTVLLQRFADH